MGRLKILHEARKVAPVELVVVLLGQRVLQTGNLQCLAVILLSNLAQRLQHRW
jgi:hypothetical protein